MPRPISAGGGGPWRRRGRDVRGARARAGGRGRRARGAREVGDQLLEVTDGDRGVGEPDALLELVVREAPEQRVLAQEGHHAFTFGVGRTELGVRHAVQCGGSCARLQPNWTSLWLTPPRAQRSSADVPQRVLDTPARAGLSCGRNGPGRERGRVVLSLKTVGVACLLAGLLLVGPRAALAADPPLDLERLTVSELQQKMAAGELTSVQLTRAYIDRIAAVNARGPGINAVRIVNPTRAAGRGAARPRARDRPPAAARCTASRSWSRTTSTSPACRPRRAASRCRTRSRPRTRPSSPSCAPPAP